jgi:hypothetical protein
MYCFFVRATAILSAQLENMCIQTYGGADISEDGFVHTKADIDDSVGLVKRIRLSASPELIQKKAEEIADFIRMIDSCGEEI